MRHQAIRNIYSNVVTIYEGDPWQYLDADGNDVVIDEDAVQSEQDRLQSEYDALQYQRDRQPEYPSIASLTFVAVTFVLLWGIADEFILKLSVVFETVLVPKLFVLTSGIIKIS